MTSNVHGQVTTNMPPAFFSIEFHTRFFPALIRSHLRLGERAGTGFSSTIELQVTFAICAILVAIGIPNALSHKSISGWVMGGMGGAGILALLLASIFSRRDPPSYDRFLTGVFFFFLTLGLTAGVFTGTLNHSLMLGVITGSAALAAGYLLGILAGMWLQYIGWFSGIVNGLACLASFGMFFTDLVLLAGSLPVFR